MNNASDNRISEIGRHFNQNYVIKQGNICFNLTDPQPWFAQ